MPVFPPQLLGKLAYDHFVKLEKLYQLEQQLKQRFHNMDDAVRGLVLAFASGEPLLLIGDPGTAKSRLLDDFCELLGLEGKEKFKYLLTQFTEPGELFGFYDISKAVADKKIVRMKEQNKIQEATVIYLDEVFRASSAILNSLLTLLQERKFYDRGETIDTPWQCLVGATNYPPESDELAAMYDRFLIRYRIKVAEPYEVGALLDKGWTETYKIVAATNSFNSLLKELEQFRIQIRTMTTNDALKPNLNGEDEFSRALRYWIIVLRRENLSNMSNRRMVKMLYVMMMDAIYNAVCEGVSTRKLPAQIDVGKAQLNLIPRYFVDRFGTDEKLLHDMVREAMKDRRPTP